MRKQRVFALVLACVPMTIWNTAPSHAQSAPKSHASVELPAKASTAQRDWTLSGKWTYRSYRNQPEVVVNDDAQSAEKALKLIFGEGLMTLTVSGKQVTGTFDMGGGYVLDLKGSASQTRKGMTAINLVGPGRENSPTAGWEYDYAGFLAPRWKNGVDQVPSIVGTVIRAKPHGNSPAGYSASFIAVKQP